MEALAVVGMTFGIIGFSVGSAALASISSLRKRVAVMEARLGIESPVDEDDD